MGKKQIQSSASSSPSSSSESSVDQEIAFGRNQTWDIPWHKMPQQLTESLTRKKRPTPRLRKEMIRIIIDHFHKGPSSLPRKKQLRMLAQKIVAEHPESFKDDVGSGYDSLLAQLVNRADNLSRLPGSHPFKRASQSNDSTPPKKRKTDSYGCISWQPDTFPAGETEKTQQQKMEELQTLHKSGQQGANIKELMNLTYTSQRNMINSKDCVLVELMEKWPYLFEEAYLLDHFSTLTGVNLKEKVEESAKKKIPTLYRFLEQQASTTQRLRQTLHSIKDVMESNGDSLPKIIGSLILLCRYFDDDTAAIFVKKPGSQASGELALPGTPCVVTAGEPWEATRFQIAVDGQFITTVNNPIDALCVWFCAFYVFNLEYPFNASATAEFIQRFIVGINPPEGRGKAAKGKSIHPIVLRISNKLKDFESEWSI
ncbi:uncharacterized protein [Apostichopus japonicus]